MKIIGSVNGKVKEYIDLIRDEQSSIQLGDIVSNERAILLEKDRLDRNHHSFSMGHHARLLGGRDEVDEVPYQGYLAHYGAKTWTIGNHYRYGFWVSGGDSEKVYQRYSQELDTSKQIDCIKKYKTVHSTSGLDFFVSHEAPSEIAKKVGYNRVTATSHMLQHMLSLHKPKIWLFGKYQKSFNEVIDGVRFIGLAELEAISIGRLL